MVFILNNLNPIGGQSRPRKSIPQGTPVDGGIAVWSYFHPTDALTAIDDAGYFNEARDLLSAGDAIFVSVNGAAVSILTFATVPATGDVTVQAADINSAV